MKKLFLLLAFLLIAITSYCDEDVVDGYTFDDFEIAQWNSIATPSLSPTNAARIFYNGTSDTLKLSQNGGAYSDILTSAGGEATYLRLDFENATSVPTGTGFFKVSDSETRFYVEGIHIHTWEVTGINFVFVDGNNFTFVDGNNFIFN